MERFIIGTGRCGSTLLSKMLNRSPEMASIFEFFNGLQGDRRFSTEPVDGEELWRIIAQPHHFVTMLTSRGFEVEEVAYPFGQPGMRYEPGDDLPWLLVATLPRLSGEPDLLFDETRRWTQKRPSRPLVHHYRELFSWLASQTGAKFWNERSGSGIDYTAELAGLYPEARFLHIHRAGEEAALSMRKHAAFRLAVTLVYDLDPEVDLGTALSQVRPDPRVPEEKDPLRAMLARVPAAEHFGRFWSDQLVSGYRAVCGLRPDQYLEVAFEDLVVAPADSLYKIGHFFDMDLDLEDWRGDAAALVREAPAARRLSLKEPERLALEAACRAGNKLLGRAVPGPEAQAGPKASSLHA